MACWFRQWANPALGMALYAGMTAGCSSESAKSGDDQQADAGTPPAGTGGEPSGAGGSSADAGAGGDELTGGGGTTDPVDKPPEGALDAGTADAGADNAGPVVDRSDPDLYEFALLPSDLDPDVSDFDEEQFAQLDTRTQPLGKLVFFLPGANNTPAAWRNHGRKLAEFGFHVVIPHYNNSWGSACSGQGGDCNANTRWEALMGEDTSSVIEVSRADSAEARVLAMLEYLSEEHPAGDWGYYLNADGSLRDDQVIIAGISHGASSTGLFASRRKFYRAVMHSGGYGNLGDNPQTPIEVFYGLSHTDDEQHAAHLSSWESAGLLGSPTNIDGQASFGEARQLITSEPNTYPHCSVAVHSSSPTDADGAYLFEPAWRYMYGAPALAP